MTVIPVKTAAEALFIAAEMERRAISLYERALMLFSAAVHKGQIEFILSEERKHLGQFESLQQDQAALDGDTLLLSAYAAGILHPGGLSQAVRSGAFASGHSLLEYAARQEQLAIEWYQRFLPLCPPPARQAFETIIAEEQKHWQALNQMRESQGSLRHNTQE